MPERTARRRPRPGTILLNHWDGSPGSLDDGSIELDSNIVLPARSGGTRRPCIECGRRRPSSQKTSLALPQWQTVQPDRDGLGVFSQRDAAGP
jgi:hypothetical protein